MENKETSQTPGGPVLDQEGNPVTDEKGETVRWATKGQRLTALILALVVVAITLAFTYAIATGDIFFR